MLLKDFYKIHSVDSEGGTRHKAVIVINEHHDVFKGHFPDNPIVPGVCMMQIIKELTEQVTGKALFMQSLSNVKFMALINPFVTPQLYLDLDITTTEDNLVKVKNTTNFDTTVALKLSAVYKIV